MCKSPQKRELHCRFCGTINADMHKLVAVGKKRSLFVIGGVLLAVLVLGAGVWALQSHKKHQAQQKTAKLMKTLQGTQFSSVPGDDYANNLKSVIADATDPVKKGQELMGLGNIYTLQGKYDDALTAYQQLKALGASAQLSKSNQNILDQQIALMQLHQKAVKSSAKTDTSTTPTNSAETGNAGL
jgi:cytochrome c-type biogenesis protein CcmH/NrfG